MLNKISQEIITDGHGGAFVARVYVEFYIHFVWKLANSWNQLRE